MKSKVLKFLREFRCMYEEVCPWRFEVKYRKQDVKLEINNLNGVKDLVVVRVVGEAPEEFVRGLFLQLRRL